MAVAQPPAQDVEAILLRELERVDEMVLEELERVDEMLLRIVAAIDQLPGRIASASGTGLSPASGNGTGAAEPAPGRAHTRPFDPYGEDDGAAAEDKESAASQVAGKLQIWAATYIPDWEAPRFATLSLAVAVLATAIALVGLTVAVF
jgi:hypothetical protein